jgi:adenosylmethionine-8-amino-7-oxononanoate aminotransferase
MNMVAQQQDIIWHPFTQQQTADLPIFINRAKGSYVYDNNNFAYLDLISSWWVNLHGHVNEDIAIAIYKQALSLEHVIFAGFVHAPAINLCKMILELLPEKLTKCFFF